MYEKIKAKFEERIQELKDALWKSYSVEKEARLSECQRMLIVINALSEDPTAPRNGSGKRMKVITLCGSTRFKEQFLEQQKRLTLEGNVVISVGLFGHSGDEEVWKPGMKEMLDKMHFQKIDMADEIFVINVGGYIGESTRREIAHAEKTGKPVRYLESV